MTTPLPLGEHETQTLEFKAAEALSKPFTISREVVAMLNAQGGELWIGLREDQGIAVEAQPIAGAEIERKKLLDHLMETIEPRHSPGEIQVEVVPAGPSRSGLLRLRIQPEEEHRPFALLHQGGRQYLLRVDHRTRPMTREEVFLRSRTPAGPSPTEVQLERLRDLRDAVVRTEPAGLWVAAAPVPACKLDLQARELVQLLDDPTASGNRASGWNYRMPNGAGFDRKLDPDRLENRIQGHFWIRIHVDGCIEFWSAIQHLHHGTEGRKEIYPLALLEFVTSIARLAAHVYAVKEQAPPQAVWFDGSLVAPGWELPAYPRGTTGYRDPLHGLPGELESGRWSPPAPLRFEWEDLSSQPDHAGYMLVRQVYRAFDLPEDRIPQAYDRIQRRLVLPE